MCSMLSITTTLREINCVCCTVSPLAAKQQQQQHCITWCYQVGRFSAVFIEPLQCAVYLLHAAVKSAQTQREDHQMHRNTLLVFMHHNCVHLVVSLL